MKLTKIQLKHLKNCPECNGNMREEMNEIGRELLLICDDCKLCMDSEGGVMEI